jgi:hypothetical protein
MQVILNPCAGYKAPLRPLGVDDADAGRVLARAVRFLPLPYSNDRASSADQLSQPKAIPQYCRYSPILLREH